MPCAEATAEERRDELVCTSGPFTTIGGALRLKRKQDSGMGEGGEGRPGLLFPRPGIGRGE